MVVLVQTSHYQKTTYDNVSSTTSSYQDAKQQAKKNLLNAVLRVQDKQVLWFLAKC